MGIFDRIISFLYLVQYKRKNFERLVIHISRQQRISKQEALFKYMDDIDNKSAALLSHVSMIIAAVSIMISVFEGEDEVVSLLFVEMGIYIFVAIGLLRCVSIVRPRYFQDVDYIEVMIKEAESRLVVYERARALAILATFGFLVGVIYKAGV